MDNNFIEKCNELQSKITEIKVTQKLAAERITESVKNVTELVEQLEGIEIPIVDGEPLINFKIDKTKLGQPIYVKQILDMIPDVLKKIETEGCKLIDNALVKE